MARRTLGRPVRQGRSRSRRSDLFAGDARRARHGSVPGKLSDAAHRAAPGSRATSAVGLASTHLGLRWAVDIRSLNWTFTSNMLRAACSVTQTISVYHTCSARNPGSVESHTTAKEDSVN